MTNKGEALENTDAQARVPDTKVEQYDQIRSEAEAKYKTFGAVACPALSGKLVHFTSEGFNHLIYRIAKQERDRRVQIMRFEMLGKAKELVEKTTTMQEYEVYYENQIKRRFKNKVSVNVKIADIGFVGIIRGFRIKVVVSKQGDGDFKFVSVIPAWSTQYYRDIKVVRNTKGNVSEI